MKPLRAVLLTATLLAATVPAQAGGLAHVDAEAVVQAMPAYKRAQAQVEAYGKQLQEELEAKQARMQAYYSTVMADVQAGRLTPVQQQEAEKKLAQMQSELQQAATDADAKLLKKEQELVEPLYASFDQALRKVADKKDYDYIIDKKIVLLARGPDATAAVKAELGI